MGNLLLPASINNRFDGQKLALFFFWIVVIVRGFQGAYLIVNGHSIVEQADGIPLETFPITASESIVAVFVLNGASRLLLSVVSAFIFIRYRGMIPLMLLMLALDQIAKEVLLRFYPLYRVGHPVGPTVNVILLSMTIIGFVLSVIRKKPKRPL